MTPTNHFSKQAVTSSSLIKPMLWGAGLGLTFISLFILTAGEPNAEWPKFWMVRPLLIVPIAGAFGGAFMHFMIRLSSGLGWKTTAFILVGIVGYIVALWMGIVLGLDGTMWD